MKKTVSRRDAETRREPPGLSAPPRLCHVRQFAEQCNRPGGGRSGICTDGNDPTEMDAYLATIEAVTVREPIRDAWVRVVSNWDFLSPQQQAAFAARRDVAGETVARCFPGVAWAGDPDVLRYQRFCRTLQGGAAGECDSALAPVGLHGP